MATVPVNVDNGSNVTEPSEFTVYVPSPGTVREVLSQLFGVCAGLMPHNFTEVATNGKSELPAVSLESGVYDWFVSYTSEIASGEAVGTGGGPTVGVMVESTERPNVSSA